MCFGCPSVATAVGGVPEVVESGVSGLLVAPGDPDALARGLESLIADPALRSRLGKAARQRAAEMFSAGTIVSTYERLYHRVCSAAGHP
jgi:glycosyltransferase involved in cell wall biosynthesis